MAVSTIYITQEEVLSQNGVPTPSVTFDCVTEFQPRFNSTITSFPVSDKSQASDHRIKQNVVISVRGYVSTTPLIAYDNNLVGYNTLSERPKSAYNIFKAWWENGTELTAVNEYEVFTNLILKDFEPIQEGTDSILMSLSFEGVRRVTYKRVTLVQNMSDTKKLDANPNVGKFDSKKNPTERESQVYKALVDIGILGEQTTTTTAGGN